MVASGGETSDANELLLASFLPEVTTTLVASFGRYIMCFPLIRYPIGRCLVGLAANCSLESFFLEPALPALEGASGGVCFGPVGLSWRFSYALVMAGGEESSRERNQLSPLSSGLSSASLVKASETDFRSFCRLLNMCFSTFSPFAAVPV
uniref:(northern house mosquito) hypothetical protein n=1 Tax=Culex pipiens TaxID=7175 RepID=A0A8D8D3H5_CULPI